jgi:zinc-finger-containing domain
MIKREKATNCGTPDRQALRGKETYLFRKTELSFDLNLVAPVCPYCSNDAILEDGARVLGPSYGFIWICAPCDAYVGVHRDSPNFEPLGRLANAELRQWKIRAHEAFDPLWESGAMTRHEAYAKLARLMGLEEKDAHIGMFDVQQCRRMITLLRSASVA